MNRKALKAACAFIKTALYHDLITHEGIVDADGYVICYPTAAEQAEFNLVSKMMKDFILDVENHIFSDELEAMLKEFCGIK